METDSHADLRESVVLRDGRKVFLRELSGADADALREAIFAADPFDLWTRFMGARPSTETLLHRLADADGLHDAAVGAFDDAGRLVGVAQFDRYGDAYLAEAAIEVATDWQRCGLGTELGLEIAALAKTRGIERFVLHYLADNAAIVRMIAKSPYAYWLTSDDQESTATINLRELREGAQ